jgi:translation initiation factor 5B
MVSNVKFDALEFVMKRLHFGGGWLIFVCLQIVGSNSEEQQKMFGRHFDVEDELVSHISRRSIDALEANYDLSKHEQGLVKNLSIIFKIR